MLLFLHLHSCFLLVFPAKTEFRKLLGYGAFVLVYHQKLAELASVMSAKSFGRIYRPSKTFMTSIIYFDVATFFTVFAAFFTCVAPVVTSVATVLALVATALALDLTFAVLAFTADVVALQQLFASDLALATVALAFAVALLQHVFASLATALAAAVPALQHSDLTTSFTSVRLPLCQSTPLQPSRLPKE